MTSMSFALTVVFLFGAILGSFLNVVIYRLHTGRSINGRSHCMSCGETLAWYELFPVVSFLVLRAHCRHCSSSIPWRYLTVELITGITFVLLYLYFASDLVLFVLHAILALILIVIAVYDLRHTIIPDELSIAAGGVVLIMMLYAYIAGAPLTSLFFDVLTGFAAALFFYLLWYFSRGRWIGLGDAKLALPLGVLAGTASALSMVVLSFWIGAAMSLAILGIGKVIEKGKTFLHFGAPRLTMKSEVPFAPFLILGFLVAYFFHADIFVITSFFVPSV